MPKGRGLGSPWATGGWWMSRRWRFLLPLLWLCLATGLARAGAPCGTELGGSVAPAVSLQRFAAGLGIQYPAVFAAVARYIDTTGQLPPCYLTKEQAQRAGWSPGANLWGHAPGTAIGGDRFGNLERRLPAAYNGQYVEADLDYAGGRRGGHRLIFVRNRPGSGLIWVTTDHYRTFHQVPRP